MLQAVADAAAHRGYALTVVTAADAGALADAFEHLRDQGVDGAIVLNEATAAARRADAPSGLALVVVDSPADERFGVVQSDHESGARAATEHLIALGHPTVWHLAGPGGLLRRRRARARVARGARGRGAGGTSRRAGRLDRGIRSSRGRRPRRPTGRVGGLRGERPDGARPAAGARRSGPRRFRATVAVVGFDDIADAADYLPPLTTVRQDFDELGERAVDALIGAIDGGSPKTDLVPTRLIVRESSASGHFAL